MFSIWKAKDRECNMHDNKPLKIKKSSYEEEKRKRETEFKKARGGFLMGYFSLLLSTADSEGCSRPHLSTPTSRQL